MTIRKLPPRPSPDDPDNFDDVADEFLAQLDSWAAEVDATGQKADADAKAAVVARTGAETAQKAAEQARDAAAQSQADAKGFRDGAQLARDGASLAREAAEAAAFAAKGLQVTATSTSAVKVEVGERVFQVGAGKQFAFGVPAVAVSTADPRVRVVGTVASYEGDTLKLAVTEASGSGVVSSWSISISGTRGEKGDPGDIKGGNLLGALNSKMGTPVPASPSPDIWGAGGDLLYLTGNADVTGFPNAPQAGARRSVMVVGAIKLVSGPNLFVKGGTQTLTAKDEFEVVAETTSTFRATISRADGKATTSQRRVSTFTNMEIVVAGSTTWIAKISGPHRVILVGPGGSGAAVSTSSGWAAGATGGGAGGLVSKVFDANAGDSFSVVLGSPGAPASAARFNGTPILVNGNSGGTSSFIGPGVSLIAYGGKGGVAGVTSTQNSALTVPVPGAVGGLASGGDVAVQGGASGSIYATSSGNSMAATGGGSVSWSGTVYSSGSITLDKTVSYGFGATGGAGIGGGSGSITVAGQGNVTTGGGGAVGASPSASTATNTTGGAGAFGGFVFSPITLGGAGGSGAVGASVSGGQGAGGGGCIGSDPYFNGGSGGILAGGGAIVMSASGNAVYAGGAGWGGGSGAAVAYVSTYPVSSHAGGLSFAIIEWGFDGI